MPNTWGSTRSGASGWRTSSGNSPAERAGLEVGDIILSVDERQVDYTAQLQQAVGFRKAGDVVTVEVARKGGVHRTFHVRLTAMEDTVAEVPRPQAPDTTPGPLATPKGGLNDLLGINVTPVTTEVRQELELPASVNGVVVTGVDPTGPAGETLLGSDDRGGPDIIVAIEGQAVHTATDLERALKAVGRGKIATLRIYNVPRKEYGVKRLRLGPGQWTG